MILLDNQEVKFGKFPNGESNFNYNTIIISYNSTIVLKYESDQDLFNLYILKQYIDTLWKINQVSLVVLYMPYSRMDRNNGIYSFNLKFVSKFINDMNFENVTVYDAHSDVTLALLDRVEEVSMTATLFNKFTEDIYWDNDLKTSDLVVMFPDAGAEKRYSKTFGGYPSVVGSKERDFATGNIIKFKISGADVNGKDVAIIDDLCSKGGTFVGAAKALKEAGANKVYLIVTHCENTIFDGDVFEHIEKVYTTNSILSKEYIEKEYNSVCKYWLTEKIDITPLYEVKKRG